MARYGSPDNSIELPTVDVSSSHFPDVQFTGSGGGYDSWGPGSGGSWGAGAGAGGYGGFVVSDISGSGGGAPGYPDGTPLGIYSGPAPVTTDSSSFSGLVPADQAHYYSGYWAGVQGALYGFGPPAAPPIHSYGFAIDVLQAIA